MKIKKLIVSLCLLVLSLFIAPPAFAHVVVKPTEVGVGQRLTFVVSVPTEEDAPTTSVRLLIPEGVQSVRPNVKPGWTVEMKKVGEGEAARVSELIWTGGSIPAEQRDEFMFSAQAPAKETDLAWKAYQTYASGTVIAWDADPAVVEEQAKTQPEGSHGQTSLKPFSVTKVINDLAAATETPQSASTSDDGWLVLGLAAALIMSGGSLWLQLSKRG